MINSWLNRNTFHHSRFSDLKELVALKEKKNLSISLCFPTLNEEKTIAKEIIIMRSELMLRYPLLDEILVIDSGSEDHTVEVAREYGAKVHVSNEILSPLEHHFRGKGENLWKALYEARGDIIVYLDADIKNIHHRFAYGLLGPLLMDETIKFTKAFYDRPLTDEAGLRRSSGGGRVTELVIRPLFSLLYPELTQIIQPLSGEYAGYREILDQLHFPIGYGVETSMLMEIYETWGLDVMAQVDLDKRVHRNQNTLALGRMSFGILQTFFRHIEKQGKIALNHPLFNEMLQYQISGDNYEPREYLIEELIRSPIIELKAYQKRFKQRKPSKNETSA